MAAVAEAAEHEEGAHHISNEVIISFGVISTILALGGIFIAWLVFLRRRIDPVAFASDHPRLYSFLYNKWYFDEVYDAHVVFPLRRFAMYLWTVIDVKVIDGTLMGIARGVDGVQPGAAHAANRTGSQLRAGNRARNGRHRRRLLRRVQRPLPVGGRRQRMDNLPILSMTAFAPAGRRGVDLRSPLGSARAGPHDRAHCDRSPAFSCRSGC